MFTNHGSTKRVGETTDSPYNTFDRSALLKKAPNELTKLEQLLIVKFFEHQIIMKTQITPAIDNKLENRQYEAASEFLHAVQESCLAKG